MSGLKSTGRCYERFGETARPLRLRVRPTAEARRSMTRDPGCDRPCAQNMRLLCIWPRKPTEPRTSYPSDMGETSPPCPSSARPLRWRRQSHLRGIVFMAWSRFQRSIAGIRTTRRLCQPSSTHYRDGSRRPRWTRSTRHHAQIHSSPDIWPMAILQGTARVEFVGHNFKNSPGRVEDLRALIFAHRVGVRSCRHIGVF